MLPTLCRELIAEWKAIARYLAVHAPRQEGQGSHNRVSCFHVCFVIQAN